MTSVGIGFLSRTRILLHCLKAIHSPVWPSGVSHLNTISQSKVSQTTSSYVSFSTGLAPPPPNDICERVTENRQKRRIINCRIISSLNSHCRGGICDNCRCKWSQVRRLEDRKSRITGFGDVNLYSRWIWLNTCYYHWLERVRSTSRQGRTKMTGEVTSIKRGTSKYLGKPKDDYEDDRLVNVQLIDIWQHYE